MWLIASYLPGAVFELRPSNTTKSGGKTLLVPTPYALKMAILDRVIRNSGVQLAEDYFPGIRDLTIAVAMPDAICVNRTFQKILRPNKPAEGKWQETIASREFCVFAGQFQFAFGPNLNESVVEMLGGAVHSINYFGQRGSFMQCTDYEHRETLPASFTSLSETTEDTTMFQSGIMQRMDDMLPSAQFSDVSAFNPKAKGARRSYTIPLPVQLQHYGRNHVVYQRLDL